MTRAFIMVAPTGARRSKADHSALPVTLPEIIAEAQACHAAGADALHLHIRDAKGQHSLDAGAYREALAELRTALPALRIQITTEAAGRFSVAEQLACLKDVRPAWASVAIREVARAPELAHRVYATAAEIGCEVQHILHDPQDAGLFEHWLGEGIIGPDQRDVIHVLGRYDGKTISHPDEVAQRLCPEASGEMLCAFGPQEHACLLAAARHGMDLRVGFENSILAPGGAPWQNNAASVAALRAALEPKPAQPAAHFLGSERT